MHMAMLDRQHPAVGLDGRQMDSRFMNFDGRQYDMMDGRPPMGFDGFGRRSYEMPNHMMRESYPHPSMNKQMMMNEPNEDRSNLFHQNQYAERMSMPASHEGYRTGGSGVVCTKVSTVRGDFAGRVPKISGRPIHRDGLAARVG